MVCEGVWGSFLTASIFSSIVFDNGGSGRLERLLNSNLDTSLVVLVTTTPFLENDSASESSALNHGVGQGGLYALIGSITLEANEMSTGRLNGNKGGLRRRGSGDG